MRRFCGRRDFRFGSGTIRGEKKAEKEEKKQDYWTSERSYGAFERSFTLPTTVDAEHIKAHYDNGVLNLVLPKIEKAKPRLVKVEVKPPEKALKEFLEQG